MTSPAAVVQDYQDRAEQLAASTAAGVLALYAALRAGGLAPASVVPAMAAVVNMANAAAVTLADLGIAVQIETATGVPTPPTGIPPTDDSPRLERAVATILDDLPDDYGEEPEPGDEPPSRSDEPDPSEAAGPRLERLARSEPLETGHAVTVEIINRLPVVAGWTRVLDADPCPRCIRWAEDGRVFPPDAHFKRHLNCNCQQQIVTSGGQTASDTTREGEPE